MRSRALVVAALATAIGVMACRAVPIRNVYQTQITPPESMSDAALLDSFRRAGAETGWVIRPVAPGELEGRLTVHGRHLAVVTIVYDRTQFSIQYKNSENLLYDGVHIHRNYNRWVQNLEKNIREAVNLYPPDEGAEIPSTLTR